MNTQTKIKWPSNEEVSQYKFDDTEIDNMVNFNFYARAALIAREVTRDDYIVIERCIAHICNEAKQLTKNGKCILAELVSSI